MITEVKVNQPFPDLAHRGHLLPLGSTIADSTSGYRSIYRTVAPRTWVMDGNAYLDGAYGVSQPFYLRSLPEGDSMEMPRESAEQFLWRLRDTTLAAAERHGVNFNACLRLVAEFGSGAPRLMVGEVVSNGHDIKALPVGSIVYSGHPDKPRWMNVWEMAAHHDLVHVTGTRSDRYAGLPVTIYSMPGTPELVAERPASEEQIARIGLRAWRVGKSYKSSQGWCSVFEHTIRALGINDELVAKAGTTHGPGDTMTRDEARLLPEGTLLRWEWRNRAAMAVYVREDSASNRSRTRRIWGWEDDNENSHDSMIVCRTPTEPMAWVANGLYLRHMPNGVVFQANHTPEQVLSDETRREISDSYAYYMRGFDL